METYTVYVSFGDGSVKGALTLTDDAEAAANMVWGIVNGSKGVNLSVGIDIAYSPSSPTAQPATTTVQRVGRQPTGRHPNAT